MNLIRCLWGNSSIHAKIRSTLAYGYMKAKDDNRFAELQHNSTTQNKQLWQGWANTMYNPYKPITLGVEYVYGERELSMVETGWITAST